MSEPKPASRLAHATGSPDAGTGAVVPPLHPATTFGRDPSYDLIGDFVYSRYSHPTAELVEEAAADVDGGEAAMAFSSGMSAFVALLETVPTGSHVVAQTIMYHGGLDWLRRLVERRALRLSLFDPADPMGPAAAIKPGETDLVWIETPANPTWDVVDIASCAALSRAAGAQLVVDSTGAPPVTTRPLEFGADYVFHSASKYYNGHSDVTAGLLVAAKPDARWEDVAAVRRLSGTILDPFGAWLLLRGMRTLAVRFSRASENALHLAEHFAAHPAVESVLYPGLVTHPTHETAVRQMTGGFGGMLSMLVHGDAATARAVAGRTRLIVPATSLGGVETLIEHRASVEGPHSLVAENLLRLSVGIEDVDDLVPDLEQACANLG